jgi:hypothetical protein
MARSIKAHDLVPHGNKVFGEMEPMNPATPVTTLRGMNPSFKSWTYDDRGVCALLWSVAVREGDPRRAARDTT